MPPLKIPLQTEKRILQTDASDEYWSSVLIIINDKGTREICGYKSGTFKDSEKHYHSTFKEILAVKRGIEKFQFHLIGHEFQVEMDMSSFPRMLKFKRKALPDAQLLRWANWFSQWKFTVKYIKGKDNILADFLSRPTTLYKKEHLHVPKPTHSLNVIPMVFTINSCLSQNEASSSEPPQQDTPQVICLPEQIVEAIADLTLQERSKLNYKTFLTILLRNCGLFLFKGLEFHPEYPFLNIFFIDDLYRLPKEALCFFWYLFETYTIGISFESQKLLTYLLKCQFESIPHAARNLNTLLLWFFPTHERVRRLSNCSKYYAVIMFRRPCSYLPPAVVSQHQSIVYHYPTSFIHNWYNTNPSSYSSPDYMEIRCAMALANNVNPMHIPIPIIEGNLTWLSKSIPPTTLTVSWNDAYSHWKGKNLYVKNEEISDDDYESDYEGLEDQFADMEDDTIESHWDPYEDDPSHPDSRWK